jgi:hypothetical protein
METTTNLYIKDGKFYDKKTNEPVKLEFGNAEQIACKKRYEEMKTDGADIGFQFELIECNANFQCACGKLLRREKRFHDFEFENSYELFAHFRDDKVTCPRCAAKFKIVKDNYDNYSAVML